MSGQELYEAWRAARMKQAGDLRMWMPGWGSLPGDERGAWLLLAQVVKKSQRGQREQEDLAEAVTMLIALQVRAEDEALCAADLDPVLELLEPEH